MKYLQKIINPIFTFITKYTFERWRIKYLIKQINLKNITVADIGCKTTYLKDKIEQQGNKCVSIDINPVKGVIYGNVENLKYPDNHFDVVICSEVLEHLYNPIKAMGELKRVTKKKLIISIPYEPFFTIWRFMIWEFGHLWTIHPKILKKYIGESDFEKKIIGRRYYIAVWNFGF